MKRIVIAAAFATFLPLASVAIAALSAQSVTAGENDSPDCGGTTKCGPTINDGPRGK